MNPLMHLVQKWRILNQAQVLPQQVSIREGWLIMEVGVCHFKQVVL